MLRRVRTRAHAVERTSLSRASTSAPVWTEITSISLPSTAKSHNRVSCSGEVCQVRRQQSLTVNNELPAKRYSYKKMTGPRAPAATYIACRPPHTIHRNALDHDVHGAGSPVSASVRLHYPQLIGDCAGAGSGMNFTKQESGRKNIHGMAVTWSTGQICWHDTDFVVHDTG